MVNGETTNPATTPDRIESSSVKFDPTVIGDTLEEKLHFLCDRLFGEYSETIKLPQDTTVEQFKEFLKRDWIFRIKENPALAAELNALVPYIIDELGEELYRMVVWESKTMIPDEDPDPRRHYAQGGQSAAKGAVGTAADPVNLFNGNFSYSTQDFLIDGAGIVFSFTRFYSQEAVYNGPLGFKWNHNYNLWISVSADQQHLTLSEGDLQLHHFRRHELHDYFVPPDGKCAVILSANNSFVLQEPDGNKIIFQPHDLYHPTIHVASRVEDKFGNYLQFHYNNGLLSRVEVNHPARTVSFFYDSIFRISRIRDFTGRTWQYTYDDLGDLAAVTTPPTAEYKRGLTTQYNYSSYLFSDPVLQHNLVNIIDADGRIYLENEYGTDRHLLNYNRVVRQRQGGGEMLFEYADVVEAFDFRFRDHERPAHQTLVTDSDGRQTRYLFNKAGNTILRETYARVNGLPTIVATHYRYNRDGNLVGIMSPLGVITQYLYERDHYEKRHPQTNDYSYAKDSDLTVPVRLGFNNLLAVVQRMNYYKLQDSSLAGGIWSASIFPDIYTASSKDIIHKFTYEDEFAQITSSSDPRFTASADPDFSEPPDYALHLTRYIYAPGNGHAHWTLASVTLPRPMLPDGNAGPEVVTHFREYDEHGRLMRTVGPGGLEIVNDYYTPQDGLLEGFQKSITSDPGVLNIRFEVERDLLGRATKQFRPKFFVFNDNRYFNTVVFNELNQVTRTTSTAPFSIKQTFTYNRIGLQQRSLTELKDDNNVLTGHWEEVKRYDEQFHLKHQLQGVPAEGKIRVSKAVFDAAGRPRISIDFTGLKEKYTYNERGLKARAIADYGSVHAVTSFHYDADGRMVSSTDANGNATRCRYDAGGRLIDQEDALGNRIIIHYDKTGNPFLHMLFERVGENAFRLLMRKEFRYDALKRMIVEGTNKFEIAPTVTEAQLLSSFTTAGPGELLTCEYYYSASGQLYQFKDMEGQVYRSEYDILGRLTRSIDPLGDEIRYTYDAENNITRIDRKELTWNKDGTQVIREQYFASTNVYDELNRLVEETNSLGCKLSYTYDSRGNLLRLSGPLDTLTENTLDLFGRIVTKTDHLHSHIEGEPVVSLNTRYEYNKFDQVVLQTDPLGRVTQFEYDSRGRLVSTILPDQSSDRISYDKCDNVVQVKCRNNVIKHYQHNALHQQIECRIDDSKISAGNTIEGAFLYQTVYDALGRAIVQENDFCRIENSYNSLDWNISETTSFQNIPGSSGLAGLRIRREFNNTNGLTALQYPSGRKIVFERDVLDRITEIRQLQKGNAYPGNVLTPDNFAVATMNYEGLRKKGLARSNGCHTQLSYDFGGRIIQIVHGLHNATLLDCRYLYDALGNMHNKGEWTSNAAKVQQFAFDSLSRLREVKPSLATSIDISQLGPSLQPIPDNIPLYQSQVDQRMIADGAVPEMQLDYDHMGNRLLVSTPSGNESYQPLPNDQYQAVNGHFLEYDANGNLAEDTQFSYRYDHNNQLSRIENKNTGRVTRLFYDPLGRNCAQQTEDGTRLTVYNGHQMMEEYVEGTLVSSLVFDPGQDVPLLRSHNNRELFYCSDLGRSIRLVLDGNQPLAFYSYDAFGRAQQTGIEPNEFLFGGKRLMPGTDIYDFLFRAYDPAMGRFLQRDPAGYIDGLNLYTYAGNDPLSHGDPTGLERRELWLGKEIGANFASPDIDIHDPNLGKDDISIYYFDEHGTFLRWNEHTSSWVEDYTGVNIVIDNAPEPKRSWLERYLNGVKRGVMAPVHLAKDTVAKVVDMGTQGFAVLGKATGGWDTGYTTWSSTSKAVEAGVSQKELLWQATGGLVVNPVIAVGDVIFKQDPDALGEIVGGVMVGGMFKGFRDRGGASHTITQGAFGNVIPRGGNTFKYSIDGTTWPKVKRFRNVASKITRERADVKLYKKSLKKNWEFARYDRRFWWGKKTITDRLPDVVTPPPGARNVLHTHPDGLALPSPGDMNALLHYPVGTVEAVLGRAFPHADALLRKWGLPESGLVMKTTYCR